MEYRTTILHDKNGKELVVPVRRALPVTAASARYTGFKQETLLLKKGSIRLKGYKPLPCGIILERDVPIVLRDGVTIYKEGYTYLPDSKPEMYTIGGSAMFAGSDVSTAEMPWDHNKGLHRIYSGGDYDSYLYVPFVPVKEG